MRYRYYVSSAIAKGRSEQAGSVQRIPAPDIEDMVVETLNKQYSGDDNCTLGELIDQLVQRVVIGTDTIMLTLKCPATNGAAAEQAQIPIPWTPPRVRRHREIILPEGHTGEPIRRMRPKVRANILKAIATGRRYLSDLQSGRVVSTKELATCAGCSERSIRMTLTLAFLAPDLVQAVIDGTLPQGIGVTRLMDLPADWDAQRKTLDLPPRDRAPT